MYSKYALPVFGSVLIIVEQSIYRRSFTTLFPFTNKDVDVLPVCDAIDL